MLSAYRFISALPLFLTVIIAFPLDPSDKSPGACKTAKVAILGAGVTGITAAQALSNASIDDFVILEYNDYIGGRVKHVPFGTKPDGSPYIVELGANWVQGIGTPGGPENPIWRLAKKYKLVNTYSDYSSVETYNGSGASDYLSLMDDFEDSYATFEQDAGYILRDNLQDRSARTGFSLANWKPQGNPDAQAVEFYLFDYEYARPPEESSQEFSVVNYNTTFYQWSDENNFVFDQRGFNAFIQGEAATFLKPDDSRLSLNTRVENIKYSDSDVTVTNSDGSCVKADYAICTFSVGVLQDDLVTFSPELPLWKRTGIESFQMTTYTKIFLQFPPEKIFWNSSTQFFLYADTYTRGYYPVWQSLDSPGFIPGSGILFVTVVYDQSYTVEAQDDETTKQQVLEVLRLMFGANNVPEPIAFMYPRWTQTPWARGSYSNFPPGTTLEMHENLRANVGRLWFAGEATSAEYYGFLHGAWYEGRAAGKQIAGCLGAEGLSCKRELFYEELHGTTPDDQYNLDNGWMVSSFLTYGFQAIKYLTRRA